MKWSNRPIVADTQGGTIDRGGGETLKEMELKANGELVEVMGDQIKNLFASLTQKQEGDNRKPMEENAAIRRQMPELELEKLEQNNRMEQLMTALPCQVRGGQPSPMHTPISAEVTPLKDRLDMSEEEQTADFRRQTEAVTPNTLQR